MSDTSIFSRTNFLSLLYKNRKWDVIVIGGGATGLGIAVDSATRGFSTLLLEQSDFAKGTSSRSTKLVHGGVRYLAQGNIKLVIEALHERGLLLQNAPHLVKRQSFVIPCYNYFSRVKYFIGLKLYDRLSGRYSFGRSQWLNAQEVHRAFPHIRTSNLAGGIEYFDGQFDDARLAINLAQTAAEHQGVVLNYTKVTGLLKEKNRICGVQAVDLESKKEHRLQAKTVINATGVFVDDILQMDAPERKQLVQPSQGIHLVFDKNFFESNAALMIPETADGRVLFAVPWNDRFLVGTTDTPLQQNLLEPVALEAEINFILNTLHHYVNKPPARSDVLSVFAGLRPLAASQKEGTSTKEISRSHKIFVTASGLITIVGGKWTTYRKMAEDAVNKAIEVGKLNPVKCRTKDILIHGASGLDAGQQHSVYGTDWEKIQRLIQGNPSLQTPIAEGFPYRKAEVIWAVREEMARTVEDVLARRLRLLFLDAQAAIDAAPIVATLMAEELECNNNWEKEQVESFVRLAQNYLLPPNAKDDYETLGELTNLSA